MANTNHTTRNEILRLLLDKGELNGAAIQRGLAEREVHVSQTAISYQMRGPAVSRMVCERSEGRAKYYRILDVKRSEVQALVDTTSPAKIPKPTIHSRKIRLASSKPAAVVEIKPSNPREIFRDIQGGSVLYVSDTPPTEEEMRGLSGDFGFEVVHAYQLPGEVVASAVVVDARGHQGKKAAQRIADVREAKSDCPVIMVADDNSGVFRLMAVGADGAIPAEYMSYAANHIAKAIAKPLEEKRGVAHYY